MREHILDNLRAWIRTVEIRDGEPYGFRVTAIGWNSGFRRSGLRPGDLIVACEGDRYSLERRRDWTRFGLGMSSEDQYWRQRGARDDQEIEVLVQRGARLESIRGRVRAERTWQNDEGRAVLGPGGPQRIKSDGFSRPWADWLERQMEDMAARVLDDGWRRGTVHNNRQLLEEHLAQKPRVDFLLRRYPGPFAEAIADDWQIIREALEGRRYEIAAAELRWRTLTAQRQAQVADCAARAFAQCLESMATQIVPAFPAVDAMRDERAAVAGKMVVLPRLGNDDWTMDAGRAWLIARDRSGAYFGDSHAPGLHRALVARTRYERAVAPNLAETYQIIGRIGANPKMLVVRGVATPGLLVEPVAVKMGDAVFIDVSVANGRFAGEDSMPDTHIPALPDDADAEQVMNAFVQALKIGDEAAWRELFAPWDAAFIEGQIWYQPLAGPAYSNALQSEWIRARRLLEKQVYDVRVVTVDPVTVVIRPEDFSGAPLIERTRVEVDHIGCFDGEYRGFKDSSVTRLWTLQRRDGGPWRIVTDRGI